MRMFSDDEWLAAWHAAGCSPNAMSKATGLHVRNIYTRRDSLEGKGHSLKTAPVVYEKKQERGWTYPAAVNIDVCSNVVLIGGDCHFWPDQNPLIWQAFVKVAHYLKPAVIILNGDVLDFSRISRHPRLRGQNAPRVTEELDAAHLRLRELPSAPRKFWNCGNHCLRLDGYLANQAPEVDDFHGGLSDRFSDWTFAYSTMINGNTEVRHMWAGGEHAAFNNARKTGINIVTNHTHGLEIRSIMDRRGTRYGIETGMLSDPSFPQYEFDQGAVRRCAPGFVVLTYDEDGMMLPPEKCELHRGQPYFRATEVLAAKPRISVRADVL
jgi:hypothetical protein